MLAAYFYLRLVHALVLVLVLVLSDRRQFYNAPWSGGEGCANPAHTQMQGRRRATRDARRPKVPTTMYFRNIRSVHPQTLAFRCVDPSSPLSKCTPCCSTPEGKRKILFSIGTPSGDHLTGRRCQPKPPAQPHAASPRAASPTWQLLRVRFSVVCNAL